MSTAELIVSILCTVAGYALVSWLLNHGARKSQESRPEQPEPPPSASSPSAPRPGQAPWHQVLGVSPDATRAEIASAYRSLISQYHPDKVTRLGPEIRAVAERKSAELNRAYEQALSSRPVFP
jgi:DnaJ-domain-containing protein 1